MAICDPFETPEQLDAPPPATRARPEIDTEYEVSAWSALSNGILRADYRFTGTSCDPEWDGHTAWLYLAQDPPQVDALRAQVPRPSADPRLLCARFVAEAREQIHTLRRTLWSTDRLFAAGGPEPIIVRGGDGGDIVFVELYPGKGARVLLVARFDDEHDLGFDCAPDDLLCTGCASIARAFGAPEPSGASVVYFVQAATGGPIKIGTSANVAARVAALQTASPTRLRVLATAPGGVALERALHVAFAAERLEGEWFSATPALLALVRELGGTR